MLLVEEGSFVTKHIHNFDKVIMDHEGIVVSIERWGQGNHIIEFSAGLLWVIHGYLAVWKIKFDNKRS